jgi:hypothetical protein
VTNLLPIQQRTTRRVPTAAPRPSVFAVRLGLSGIALSVLFMLQLTVAGWDRVGVLDTTMSFYVFEPGIGWMFGAAVLCMSVAGIGAMIGLRRVGLADRGAARLALALAVLGALLAAVFPTTLGEELTVSAQIHRYAAGVAFFCVPIAAFLITRQLADVGYLARYRKWLSANVLVTSVLVVLFVTSHFGIVPELMQELNGLFQRLLYVMELALFGQIVLLPLRFGLPATR